MKIDKDQYKKLKRFSNFLMSEDNTSIEWQSYVYDYGDADNPYGPFGVGGSRKIDGIENFRDVISFLELVMETTLEKLDYSKYMGCDDCTGNGTMNILFYPETLKMEFVLDVEEMVTHSYSKTKTFKEISEFTSDYYGERFDNMKKLNDPNFVNQYAEELGPHLEVTYDGGGDSGYIQDEEGIPAVFGEISFEILSAFYSGWEINEGSRGTITYDFINNKVSINHDLFETEGSNVDVYEIDFTE